MSALEAESHSAHYRFIIHYGTSFRPTDLPSGVTPGKERCCAWNSFHLARENPESYFYYEGLATHISAKRSGTPMAGSLSASATATATRSAPWTV